MNFIEERSEKLIDNVIGNCSNLFTISQRYIRKFERGTYSCAILKASKRMRSNLGVDREILLVASTFTDQQQRTVKFLQSELRNYSGRLESTVAIVAHLDPAGNSKLRNWGRDVGISILPIYGQQPIASELDLEKILSTLLYSHDPFDISGPVSSDSNFFGRRDEAIDLARKLQQGQIRSILGIRKVGKTSIINRVLIEIRRTYDCTCIMVDCSRDDVFEADAAQLLSSIATTIKLAKNSDDQYHSFVLSSSSTSLIDARNQLEEQVRSCPNMVLIVIDEVDYITPGSPTAPNWRKEFNSFWRNLRAVYQECQRQSKQFSMLVGGVSTYWFTIDEIEGVENAALALVPEEFLSPMPTGASVAMLKRLGRISGLEISEDAAKYIAISTGNMPFWSRKCSSYIHRQISPDSRPATLSSKIVQPMVARFVKDEGAVIASVALRHLFRVHPRLRAAAIAIANGEAESISPSIFRTLCRYGVAQQNGSFSGLMIKSAFDSIILEDASKTVPELEIKDSSNALDDWAEDLSTIGRRRNIIEKRLRAIVLNFIRADAINKNALKQLKDDLLAPVSEDRKSKLSNYSAEEIMEKLMWLELVSLVKRKWPLFSTVFGDKQDFSTSADIINDRPDAHAKAIDAADLALYRRTLQKLENCIAKLG